MVGVPGLPVYPCIPSVGSKFWHTCKCDQPMANRAGPLAQRFFICFSWAERTANRLSLRGGRAAENLHVLHRNTNWHSWPHRHNSAPLSSCAPVHAPIGNVCTGASADRVRLLFRFMAWPGMFRFTSKPFSSFTNKFFWQNIINK